MKKNARRRRKSTPSQAAQADRHELYEHSVQCAEAEIDFVDLTFKQLRKRKAQVLREDFCGTANVCCEWVRRGKKRHAIGIDLDSEVLDWGRTHNLAKLNDAQRRRITLLQEDVLEAVTEPPDIVSAMNFSYWLLQDRKLLKQYFQSVWRALKDDGIFFLDAYGGYDSHKEIIEEREIDDGDQGFTYIWEQAEFNAVTCEQKCHIHFKFKDGSKLKRAFSYVWRIWGAKELREVLSDAGFRKTTLYLQAFDEETDEPLDEYIPTDEAGDYACWLGYIVAEK